MAKIAAYKRCQDICLANKYEKYMGRTPASLSDFKVLKSLAEGYSGKVFLVEKKTGPERGRLYAMKSMKKEFHKDFGIPRPKFERDILASVRSPFIVRLCYAFQTEERAFLILDFHQGGDLSTRIRKVSILDENDTRFYLSQIVLALDHIHELGVLHRDLKPGNTLIGEDGYLYLTDFGLCGLDKVSKDECGTTMYMSPEMYSGEVQTRAVDWWSLGALMYLMLTGKQAFWCKSHKKTKENILHKEPSIPAGLSSEAISLLQGLLDKNPSTRLGSGPTGVREIMTHPFFYNFNWDGLILKHMEPPFIPRLDDSSDLRYFKEEFTQKNIEEYDSIMIDPRIQKFFKHLNYVHPVFWDKADWCGDELPEDKGLFDSITELMSSHSHS